VIRSMVVCAAVMFLGCSVTTPGECSDDSGCLPGLSCSEGICVGCGGDSDCRSWQSCTADRRCALRAGMCETNAQCQPWERCGGGNACELAAGSCLAASDCRDFEDCDSASRQCRAKAGRCQTSSDCYGGFWTASCDADHQCGVAVPTGDDILLWGTLSEGACYMDAISRIQTPTVVQVGFGCYSSFNGTPVVSHDGRVFYIDGEEDPERVKIFVPDAFKREDDRRVYPSDGNLNDTRIAAPGCAADEDVTDFVLRAGSRSVIHRCARSSTYYDGAGAVVYSDGRLSSWNAQDYLLAFDSFGRPRVLTPARTIVAITGLPATTSVIDTRAHPTGFWIALDAAGGVEQLWHVANDGVATLQGTYGEFPPETRGGSGGVMDSAGALFTETYLETTGLFDAVVKRRPDGSTGTIIYSEKNAPELVNYETNYEKNFNFIHISTLFSGP
jgi:hypothetical protein